jgi:hypothetical protein
MHILMTTKKAKVFQSILKKLNIDESLTKPVKQDKVFHKVKDQVTLKEDYNMMLDLLFLPSIKETEKAYALIMVDLATDEFDIEPITDKEPSTILSATKKIFKRPYLNKPYASIRTDSGKEFLGEFKDWMYNESILHRIALPARHTQVSNVESLNRQIGRLLNGYMNTQELKTGQVSKEWISALPIIRKELNAYRKKSPKDLEKIEKKTPELNLDKEPLFNVGDLVYRKLDTPENALGDKQSGKFREGDYRYDRQPRKILQIFYYNGKKQTYRYMINGLKNASFTESQLKEAEEDTELFEVKQLLQKKVVDGDVEYLTWYYDEPKKNASWQLESELIKTIPELVKNFKPPVKKRRKKN